MSASVPNIVSNQSATAQTTSHTLSFTPSTSGVYRLNAYYIISHVGGDVWAASFEWTDDHHAWTWAPNSGPGTAALTSQPMTALVRAVAGQPIGLVYTVTGGAPSADLYLVVEDMN